MEWMIKRKTKTTIRKGEVAIHRVNKNNEISTSVRFASRTWLKITKTEYICFAISGTRCYFREADKTEGWKLCGEISKFFKVYDKWLSTEIIPEGEYNLEFDSKIGYFYIDAKNKLEEEISSWKTKGER